MIKRYTKKENILAECNLQKVPSFFNKQSKKLIV